MSNRMGHQVVFDTRTGEVDYDDNSITENTRVSQRVC